MFIAPEYQDNFYLMIKNALQQGKNIAMQLEIINANEDRIVVYCSLEAFTDEKTMLRISLIDITNQKELEAQNSFRANILENVTECIFTINKAGNITYWNTGAQKTLGYKAETIINSNPSRIFTEVDASFFSSLNQIKPAVLNKGYHWKGRSSKNESIWFQVRITPLRQSSDLAASTFIIVAKNVTLQKSAEDALRKSKSQVDTILNEIDDLIYISDPDTYEVLFANKPMIEKFGNILNHKCYRAVYANRRKCPFCKNDQLIKSSEDNQAEQHIFNEKNGRWYHAKEKAIKWSNNRLAIIHTLRDITDLKEE